MDHKEPYYWVNHPVQLHSSNQAGKCTMTPEQCAYKTRHWVNWYRADRVFARGGTYFFVAAIGVFAVAYALVLLLPRQQKQKSPLWLRTVAATRLLAYRNVRVVQLALSALSPASTLWTQSVGVTLLLAAGCVFFAAMTLGPRPYYWPNTKTLSFGNSPPIATRTGYLSLACLPFVFAFAAKANLVHLVTGISHEKLLVFHVASAWAMFVLALIHTFPFVVYHEWKGDTVSQWNKNAIWLTGVVALVAQFWLTVMSLPYIRHRAYELFKAMHFLVAIVFVVFLFLHCDFRLTSWDYFIAAGAVYFASLFYSMARTYFAHGLLHARLDCESDDSFRISIPTSSRWRPGQHMYIRFLALGLHALTAHPFTVCSVPTTSNKNESGKPSTLVFHAKPRGGITARLAALARKQPGCTVPVFIEGPYGGLPHRWREGFDKTLIVVGGSGVGFALGLVEEWIAKNKRNRGARLDVVASSRDPDMRKWFVDELNAVVERCMENSGDNVVATCGDVHVAIHETGTAITENASTADHVDNEKDSKATSQSSNLETLAINKLHITFHRGQANLSSAVRNACTTPDTAVGVVVCGPLSMSHDVATACAVEQQRILQGGSGASEVWLHREAFSN